ncbi:MAG: glutamine synthetase [SAR324 cluster bacterium]|nr:glutamine synthetase [SAR324 cluster bacterium]
MSMFLRTDFKEWANYKQKHETANVLDVIIVDILGIMRGKRLVGEAIDDFFAKGIKGPRTMYLFDSVGHVCSNLSYAMKDGDPDVSIYGHLGSLTKNPVGKGAQIMAFMEEDNRDISCFDSRYMLQKMADIFSKRGLGIKVGIELEFYLLDKSKLTQRDNNKEIITASDAVVAYPRSNSIDDINVMDDFFTSLSKISEERGIKIETLISETGPGQFELSLAPLNDVVRACDDLLFLKKAIKGLARNNNLVACFMSKPMERESGSGLHFHISLYNKASGENIFSGKEMPKLCTPCSKEALFAIRGMLDLIDESMAIFAPNANSFRRFKKGSFAPINKAWGANNRTVAVRLPKATNESARLEHRISGSDVNSYLCVAGILMAIDYGLKNKKLPPSHAMADAYGEKDYKQIPCYWPVALEKFKLSKVIPEYMGEEFHDTYHKNREFECSSFHHEIGRKDFDWYLDNI